VPKDGETEAGVKPLTTRSDAAATADADDPDASGLPALRQRIWQARKDLASAVPPDACLSDRRYLRLSGDVDKLVVEYMRRSALGTDRV
jgi:hypothetical protein